LHKVHHAGDVGGHDAPRAVTAVMMDRTDPRPGQTLFDPACGTGETILCDGRMANSILRAGQPSCPASRSVGYQMPACRLAR
jgi:hypothetical protein